MRHDLIAGTIELETIIIYYHDEIVKPITVCAHHCFPDYALVHLAVAEERVEGLPERYADAYRPTFAVPGLRTAVSNSVARSGAAPAGAEVENMEGAAFFAVAAALGVPAAEVRAVSNRVGEPFGVWRVADACEALARELALLVGEIGSVSSLD